MTVCIWCGTQISDDQIKKHIAEEHLGMTCTEGAKTANINANKPETEPPEIPQIPPAKTTEEPEKAQLTEKTQTTDTPPLPVENKRRFLSGQEILNLIHNTDTQIPRSVPEWSHP